MHIVIIKLGADGDVLRTIPIAQAIKKKHPAAKITWITRGDIADLLKPLPFINHVVQSSSIDSSHEDYDFLYNFDIDAEATSLAGKIKADKKYGFYNEDGYPAAYNIGAEYYLNTVFDDELKKSNRKTYQEMMFSAAELSYSKESYNLILTKEASSFARKYKEKYLLNGKKIIGIHMGASSRWPSKSWDKEQLKHFMMMAQQKGYEIILFGGPAEANSYKPFISELEKEGLHVSTNNPNNTKQEFAAVLNLCDIVVCNDSFALHVAIGLGKKTVSLFFCTSPYEVEGYGFLTKLASPNLMDFFPERSNEYSKELTSSITAEEVLTAAIA